MTVKYQTTKASVEFHDDGELAVFHAMLCIAAKFSYALYVDYMEQWEVLEVFSEDKYDSMVEQLIANGYPPSSVDVILKYAANHLWKD